MVYMDKDVSGGLLLSIGCDRCGCLLRPGDGLVMPGPLGEVRILHPACCGAEAPAVSLGDFVKALAAEVAKGESDANAI